ncbi:arginine N-succinyltransferase [Estrella lausannensis]|uniref:Arginine N-succinyltransferase n=1 Tax=Estrella lausannensis TaxID=483423 RepID=A0A0H5E573_9BACT|nr:arginine N-succinyltransferase [Estrella lausannensis]CRX38390.1 Arginine N-succinyltransferase [Estrella lausannensis]
MYLFRQIEEKDIDEVYQMALEAHSGVTSLPKNRDLIKKKIEMSLSSFDSINHKKQENSLFLFVLENKESQELIGVSGIKSGGGREAPLHHYTLQEEVRDHPSMLSQAKKTTRILIPERSRAPYSELCSLFLKRKERKSGIGRLLSLARFLFIKEHPGLFEREIKASLRGVFDERDLSPFYENVGRKFVDIEYDKFVDLVRQDPSLILAAIPSFPLTIELLAPEARNAIGVPHQNTVPAKHMLEAQGLVFDNEVDLLDAGPILKGNLHSTRPWIHAKKGSIAEITPTSKGKKIIIASSHMTFRAILHVAEAQDEVHIGKKTLELLQAEPGEQFLSFEL